ncbi:MAG TPA: hypothetical protein VN442_17465 [Bryobacteraceae bacterium]|nr:hypothetical protein [Bryobacteraceae bacterium]
MASAAAAAVVTGSVRLSDSQVSAVRSGKDYSGVIVWLEPLHPGDGPPAPARRVIARMEQKDKQFVPHVLAIQAGSQVHFPNLDPLFHSAFSNFSGQVFDLGLYAPGTSRTVSFNRTGVVRVFCNIHPSMSAVIMVLKNPWFAVTGVKGAFRITDVPPGEYRLKVFHERAAIKTLLALERTITVTHQDLSLPVILLSESGFVEGPHKNKYGHDYPPDSTDHSDYGVRQR